MSIIEFAISPSDEVCRLLANICARMPMMSALMNVYLVGDNKRRSANIPESPVIGVSKLKRRLETCLCSQSRFVFVFQPSY